MRQPPSPEPAVSLFRLINYRNKIRFSSPSRDFLEYDRKYRRSASTSLTRFILFGVWPIDVNHRRYNSDIGSRHSTKMIHPTALKSSLSRNIACFFLFVCSAGVKIHRRLGSKNVS